MCVYVLENFNCMLFDNWFLIGTRIVIPRSLAKSLHFRFTSHADISMRHKRNLFIFAALNSSYWELQFSYFCFLSYCLIGVCARKLQLHDAWWLDSDSWQKNEYRNWGDDLPKLGGHIPFTLIKNHAMRELLPVGTSGCLFYARQVRCPHSTTSLGHLDLGWTHYTPNAPLSSDSVTPLYYSLVEMRLLTGSAILVGVGCGASPLNGPQVSFQTSFVYWCPC